jgi:AcrR family transcriptional regulator
MYQMVQWHPMSGQADVTTASPKELLLRAAMDYVAEHGVSDLSLRQLAAAIGTSHRMLIYHFGSKEGLLIEVIRAVEQQQRDALAAMEIDPALSPEEVMWQFWKRLADPALWANERLFFEIYGQALQGRAHAAPLLDGIVESWVAPLAQRGREQGLSPADARADARLQVALARGLLLDLLATGDRKGVDAAAKRFATIYAGQGRAKRRGA